MARRRKKKFNPTGLETGLLAVGGAVIGGVAGFVLASKVCRRVMMAASKSGVISPGPNAGPLIADAMSSPSGGY